MDDTIAFTEEAVTAYNTPHRHPAPSFRLGISA
jgi:hypothetical protein